MHEMTPCNLISMSLLKLLREFLEKGPGCPFLLHVIWYSVPLPALGPHFYVQNAADYQEGRPSRWAAPTASADLWREGVASSPRATVGNWFLRLPDCRGSPPDVLLGTWVWQNPG